MAFCDHFKRCISREVWKRAANFRHGKGLAEGADWTTVFRHKRYYERGEKHGRVGMLCTIAQAAIWDPMRCFAAGYTDKQVCPFCEAADADWRHQAWLCPVVNGWDDSDIQKSNHRAVEAADASAPECLWLRGLAPWAWTFGPRNMRRRTQCPRCGVFSRMRGASSCQMTRLLALTALAASIQGTHECAELDGDWRKLLRVAASLS